MYNNLEKMSLVEYRQNAMDVLRDYHGFIPESIWQNAYVNVIMAWSESAITRALHTCRDAL